MKLFELTTRYNNTLNPSLWSGTELKRKVAGKLKKIADEFVEFLEVPDFEVEDIVITGSNANYNWTEKSDIDLHVVSDLDKIRSLCPDLADDYFLDKKTLWNEHHDITIYKQPVELYVQDSKEPHVASGIYSILEDDWVKTPTFDPPTIDDTAVQAKVNQIKYEIDKLIDSLGSRTAVDKLKAKIRDYRQAGLKAGGEWSTGNLSFKELRNNGYLEKLQKYARKHRDEELSLESLTEARYAGKPPDLMDTVRQIIRDAGYKLGTGLIPGEKTVAVSINRVMRLKNAREVVLRKRKPDNGFVQMVVDKLSERGLKIEDIIMMSSYPQDETTHAEITIRDPSF